MENNDSVLNSAPCVTVLNSSIYNCCMDIQTWFENNKDWVVVPASITGGFLVLGLIILIITGKDVRIFMKLLFILLFIVSPVIGYLLGEYLDPICKPLFEKLK